MIKQLKSNKILIILLISICIIFILNPAVYSVSCMNALSVWAFSVLPVLLPFFILTRMIVSLADTRPNIFDSAMRRIYHTPQMSFSVFVLSILSGYPMGAKLICTMYDAGQVDRAEATRMLSFCSVSGPMFIIGSVGVAIFSSYGAGIIILVANILSAMLNGLIYRGKKYEPRKVFYPSSKKDKSSNLLHESVYDALISILMIGGYIVLSFLLIDVLKNLNIIDGLANAICGVFNCRDGQNIVSSVLSGIIEMTRGIIDLNSTNASLVIKTIIASGLISFGGISVILQSLSFLAKLRISVKTMLMQKITQTIICVIVTVILSMIFIY